MKIKSFPMRRQQRECDTSSNGIGLAEGALKMPSVVCRTCPAIETEEIEVSLRQCEICERLQGAGGDLWGGKNNYYKNENDNDNENKKNNNNNNSMSKNKNNDDGDVRKLPDLDQDEKRRYRMTRNLNKIYDKHGDQFDTSVMDCSRCQSDVGHSLRCASSVVRWHRDSRTTSSSSLSILSSSKSSSLSSFANYFLSSTYSSPSNSPSSSPSSSTSSSSSSSSIPHTYSTIFKLSWIFTAIIFALTLTSTSAQHLGGEPFSTPPAPAAQASKREGVCQSVDVRNSVSQFSRLEGCRVVEGFVQILLIDHANDSSYANLTFPDLVEITGYLLLYRVNGLRSVGHLFPNLTVIRGHSLFINYALVAFEMMHLQEIGLHSLTNIIRGSVRFEKNPALCYVDTIDWDRITGKGTEHVISGNKPKNGCPVCGKHCPTRLTKKDETLCWNRQYCQHLCPKCGDNACSDSVPGECCDKNCLGGCTGTTAQDCFVCKDVILDGNRCVNKCPDGTYEFLNRRCVQENECRKMKKPREAFDIVKEYPYKPFNKSCVSECPAGYMDEEIGGKSSCKKCDGLCLKECSGASVDSIASAQKLRGCTHITGSLEIQIRGGKNIVKELEESLKMIEEIDGYLKIVRSFPLISLNFLKNLHTIHGNTLESAKYSLVVLDNQNLQELWDFDSHKSIKVLAKDRPASVFFHFNPKLCLDTIEKFRKVAGLPEFTELQVAPNSNGDKVACNVTKLKAHVTKKTSTAALIEWEAFNHHDPRSLLGYVVYFIEAPNNVTMYDGRDACGGDGWRVDDVSSIDSPVKVVLPNASAAEEEANESATLTHILTQLKPYTQYAFYVKTYTIATERSGAQSDLHYFTTYPDAPNIPRDLDAWSNASNELVIKWEPPINKNGNLTHYRIIGRWEKDDRNFLDQRNYCNEPLLLTEKKFTPAEEDRQKASEDKVTISMKPGLTPTCDCNDEDTDPTDLERTASSSIAFEDALHNQVYVKRNTYVKERRRRDLRDIVHASTMWRRDVNSVAEDKGNTSDTMVDGYYNVFNRTVYGQTTFAMKDLRHFAVYTIEVQACREPVVNDSNACCSTKSIKTARTLPLKTADDIPKNSFKSEIRKANNSQLIIRLVWEEPPIPNGLIVTYQIEYKNTNIQNIKATVVCITRQEFLNLNKQYDLRDLTSGNYSLRLRATSLAGNGAYTDYQYVYIKETNAGGSHPVLWGILIILIVAIALGSVGYALKRKFMPSSSNMRLIATVNPEYVSTVYVPDEWEVPRKKIELLRELGNGSFGMVYEGVARDVVKGKPEVKCAVKTVNENATDRERIEFLNEASVMKAFNTHHVVRLLGVVSVGQPTLVVMELMVNGDLKTYLRSHRPDVCENFSKQPPTLKRILQMAIEIADGMSYLAAKKFVHRDLAARNCMVAEDMTVKIGDFGMTRDIYETDYYRKGTKGLLPVRWMAPESLKDGVFTSYSDVWSYGIVLWEMVTLASQPYQGLSNDQVLRYVIDGGVMERPENCPDSLYTLMRRTWNHKPNQRPTFIDIATMLLSEVMNVESFERVSFYHSPEGIEARNQNASHSPQTDKDFEMASLQNLREDEAEAEGSEESPLRQDFGDFASFEPAGPNSIKISANPIYGATTRNDNSKVSPNFNEFNSSKVPLKADFDDFEGASMESLRSSRDTLDLPFAEDSLKSVKNSPFVDKKNNSLPRGNANDNHSIGKTLSPGSIAKRNFLESPRFSTIKSDDPNYENRTPQVVLNSGDTIKDTNVRKVEFPSIDELEDNKNINEKSENKSKIDYKSKPETLNNGYISGKTTQC